MNNQMKMAVAGGLILLAIAVVLFTRASSSPATYSQSLSSEIPKPRPGSPTFAPADPSLVGGRGKAGRGADGTPQASKP